MTATDRNRLVLQSMPMIHSIARRYCRPEQTLYDDLVQAGVVALLVRSDRYDPARGTWAAFAWQWARAGMTRLLRLSRPGPFVSEARNAEMRACCIDDVDAARCQIPPPDQLAIAHQEALRAQWVLLQSRTRKPRRLTLVARRLAEGHTEADVSRELNVSRERVRQLKVQALDRVRGIVT